MEVPAQQAIRARMEMHLLVAPILDQQAIPAIPVTQVAAVVAVLAHSR